MQVQAVRARLYFKVIGWKTRGAKTVDPIKAMTPESVKERPIRRCTQWKCGNMPLVFLKKGDGMQTGNGYLIAKIRAWYCPKCMGSYR